MRILGFLEFGAIVLGIVALIAGQFFGLPKGFNLGIFLVGAGVALGGLESVVARRIGFRLSGDGGDAYDGAPAVVWGLMVLMIGAAIVAFAYVRAEGMMRPALEFLVRNPLLLVGAAGFLLAGIGALLVLNPRRRSHWAWRVFVRLPQLLAGTLLILAGLGVIGGGIWQRLDPRGFDQAVKPAFDRLNEFRL